MKFKDKKPFYRTSTDESEGKGKDVITIWLNPDERKMLETAKRVLEQEKDSTAFKQLSSIGFKTISQPENAYLLEVVFANKRRNKRIGVACFEG